MKTRLYHLTRLGGFAPLGCAGADGYIRMHDSPRYSVATNEQLEFWRDNSKSRLVRAAAETERAKRQLQAWRDAK